MHSQLEALTEHDRDEVLSDLNDLLQLDHDALRAYDETILKLGNATWADQVRAFKGDHERHVRDLTAMVKRLGGEPAERPHVTAPLKQLLVDLGAAAGSDKGVLMAFRGNEMQVKAKYDKYAAKQEYPGEVAELIRRNMQDEHRHYAWVVSVLGGDDAA